MRRSSARRAWSRAGSPARRARSGSAEERTARKALARIDKRLERIAEREKALHDEMAAHLTDYDLLARVGAELSALQAEKDELELEWLELSEDLE